MQPQERVVRSFIDGKYDIAPHSGLVAVAIDPDGEPVLNNLVEQGYLEPDDRLNALLHRDSPEKATWFANEVIAFRTVKGRFYLNCYSLYYNRSAIRAMNKLCDLRGVARPKLFHEGSMVAERHNGGEPGAVINGKHIDIEAFGEI